MVVYYVCSVWGDWHINTLKLITLPSLCASQNLPAVASSHEIKFEIFTTKQDREKILALPIVQHLSSLVDLTITIASDEQDPATHLHIEWWIDCAEKARQANGIVHVIHPDSVWPNGSLLRAVEIMESGKAGIVFPWIRAVSETFVPAIRARGQLDQTSAIEISSRELMKLTNEHIHPNFLCMCRGVSTGGYPIAHCYPVSDEGIIYRYFQHEVAVVDPNRCQPNFRFKALSGSVPEEFYLIETSDDLCYVEVGALVKDFGLYTIGIAQSSLEIIKNSLVPENDVHLNEHLSRSHSKFIFKEPASPGWETAKFEADQMMSDALTLRRMVAIRNILKERGEIKVAQFLALSVLSGALVAPVQSGKRYAILLPQNTVFQDLENDPTFEHLISNENKALLTEHLDDKVISETTELNGKDRIFKMKSGREIKALQKNAELVFENGVSIIDQFETDAVDVYITSGFI